MQPAEGYHVLTGGVVTLEPGECFYVYALTEKRAVVSPYIAASDTSGGMTRVPFTLESSATVNDAALLIARRGLPHVPVTQHGV